MSALVNAMHSEELVALVRRVYNARSVFSFWDFIGFDFWRYVRVTYLDKFYRFRQAGSLIISKPIWIKKNLEQEFMLSKYSTSAVFFQT